MKKILVVFCLLALIGELVGQTTVTGTVMDANTNEGIRATIVVGEKSIETAVSGDFTFNVGLKDSVLTISSKGYETSTRKVSKDPIEVYLVSSSMSMKAVQLTASIAGKNRKTPIVYTNVTGKDIRESLGSADLPTLFNNTPGVYSTQQGGGAGDARITIRGFNQRNIAVMVDGIPVNDMENGAVYWSNWFGLSQVTSFTQIQRGLGSSRLANPSVGGTINIVTRGFAERFAAGASMEYGDANYQQYSAFVNTGRLKGDWGAVFALTKRSSDGYVDGLYDNMYSIFTKVEKRFGKRANLSFTFIGAPQEHGQRSYKARLPLYSNQLAQETGLDTSINGMVVDQGRRYNQHMGQLDRTELKDGQRVSTGSAILNERRNKFFKPQAYLKFDFKPNARMFNSAVLYASIGQGGGVRSQGIRQDPNLYGQYIFQRAYNANRYGSVFAPNVDPAYHPSLRKSTAILAEDVNNHKWAGLLNTFNYKIDKYNTFTAGIDLRVYEGEHYRRVHDLLGGEYFRPDANDTMPGNTSRIYKEGDAFDWKNYGNVRWAGTFAEYEYAKNKVSTFINASLSYSSYKRTDYFRANPDGSPSVTDWVNIVGTTLKTGLGYNLTKAINIFGNLGYLNRPSRFSNVFDRSNSVVKQLENEIVLGSEMGLKYSSRRFSTELNGYYTNWNNRPLNSLPSYATDDGEVFSYNINGLRAVHLGGEFKAIYKMKNGLSIQTAIALGDWRWKSAANAAVFDDNGDSVATVRFDATDVHVGDAAQNQFVLNLKYAPKKFLKGLYVSFEAIYFAKHFADFEPTALKEGFERTESFQTPNYSMINTSAGYNFLVNKQRVKVFLNIRNLTDALFISDANHRLNRNDIAATFNPKNVEVFVSPGRRITGGISLTF